MPSIALLLRWREAVFDGEYRQQTASGAAARYSNVVGWATIPASTTAFFHTAVSVPQSLCTLREMRDAEVQIGALYRCQPRNEDLLRRLCHDGLRRFIAEAEAAETDPDPWSALTGFLERIVEADVHSLTVHLAGTFIPTPEMHDQAQRAGALAAGLTERAQAAGRLRPDVVADDLDLVLEGCAAIRVPDPARTSELRRRYLHLLLDGLAAAPDSPPSSSPPGKAPARPPLPGPPPHGELNWRWQQR
jgi:hypothetical protein